MSILNVYAKMVCGMVLFITTHLQYEISLVGNPFESA